MRKGLTFTFPVQLPLLLPLLKQMSRERSSLQPTVRDTMLWYPLRTPGTLLPSGDKLTSIWGPL
jgi:hypothetical protein